MSRVSQVGAQQALPALRRRRSGYAGGHRGSSVEGVQKGVWKGGVSVVHQRFSRDTEGTSRGAKSVCVSREEDGGSKAEEGGRTEEGAGIEEGGWTRE